MTDQPKQPKADAKPAPKVHFLKANDLTMQPPKLGTPGQKQPK
ncbi:hypothetical protein ACFOGJ_08935 [Marinibaculum pumilum]|uniref:Uncharacterized protein n=1 Tax=Marinibaculum pumilum TaxID=1766165 RepID=A0ABV7KYH3_9PROT